MLHGHGGEIYSIARKTGLPADSLSDFSSNVSPLPLPSGLDSLLSESIQQIRHLPEVDSYGVRVALSKRFRMLPENFLISGGTTEWIYTLPGIFNPESVIIPVPTYADYADAAAGAGIPVKHVNLLNRNTHTETGSFLQALSEAAKTNRCMVFFCNPNNPTGTFIKPEKIATAVRANSDAIWVIDESYAPFIDQDNKSSMLTAPLPKNCVVLRSFSKIFGIPGLRLGYAAAHNETIPALSSAARPWQVNRLAQIAGEWLAQDTSYEAAVRKFCHREKEFFLSSLKESAVLEAVPGNTHFMLFRLKGNFTARELCALLMEKGLIIRDCHNFHGLGPDEYVRISLRSHKENLKLLQALKAIEPQQK